MVSANVVVSELVSLTDSIARQGLPVLWGTVGW